MYRQIYYFSYALLIQDLFKNVIMLQKKFQKHSLLLRWENSRIMNETTQLQNYAPHVFATKYHFAEVENIALCPYNLRDYSVHSCKK